MEGKRMQTYIMRSNLCKVVVKDYIVDLVSKNLTMPQIYMQQVKKTKKENVKLCLFVGVSLVILMRIITLKSAPKF